MKSLKGSIPNIMTFINMSLGILAILLIVNNSSDADKMIPASTLIIIAALTDRFDGKVARKLNVSSDLGKELDSLSDLVSFGVAPAIIAWKTSFMSMGVAGYLITLVFPIAGAYRLARYNTTTFNNIFSGVPITIAGAFLSLNNIYNHYLIVNKKYTNVNTSIIIVFILILSALMVSKIRIRKV